jgi:CHASE3 domain sensor protein
MTIPEMQQALQAIDQQRQAKLKDLLSTEKNLEILKSDVAHLTGKSEVFNQLIREADKKEADQVQRAASNKD